MLPTAVFLALLGLVLLVAGGLLLPTLVRTLRGVVWYARGLRAYRRGRYDRALTAWSRAVEIFPWYPSAHYNLGVLHSKAGRIDEAIAAYRKAVELNPKLAKAYFNLGNAYLAKGEYRRAAQAYEAATKTPKGHLRSHLNLGVIYQQHLLDNRKALYHFTQYIRLGGTDRRVLNNIRLLREELGEKHPGQEEQEERTREEE